MAEVRVAEVRTTTWRWIDHLAGKLEFVTLEDFEHVYVRYYACVYVDFGHVLLLRRLCLCLLLLTVWIGGYARVYCC